MKNVYRLLDYIPTKKVADILEVGLFLRSNRNPPEVAFEGGFACCNPVSMASIVVREHKY